MNSPIISDKVWDDTEVDQLTVEEHFRLRGLETTRLDTLIDAAFAFTLSMLVISQGDVPNSYAQLVDGIKSIPALIASFLVLMMFWLEHRQWSRRYGIENAVTVSVSIGLIFVLLVYVFPLRLLFEGLFALITNGYLPWDINFNTIGEARVFFAFYSVGFLAMSLLVTALYASSLKQSEALRLNGYEREETHAKQLSWTIAALFAAVSIVIALTAPPHLIAFAGHIYFGLFAVQIVQRVRRKKRFKRYGVHAG